MRQPLVDIEGFPASRFEVVYNGRDLERFRFDETVRTEVRRALGFSHEISWSCRLLDWRLKRTMPLVLRAIRRLASRHPFLRQVIVGEGPQRQELEALVCTLGLRRERDVLGARHDVERLLCAADLVVLTSVNEAIPLTLIEAMAAGVPLSHRVSAVFPKSLSTNSRGYWRRLETMTNLLPASRH